MTFTSAFRTMLNRYRCETSQDYINALKEIIQEVALLGLWRAKFFEHAAFYGGTALRILYGLDRFSENLDFSLLKPHPGFKLSPYLKAIKEELEGLGFNVSLEESQKKIKTPIESAFIKAGTKEHLIKTEVPPGVASRIQGNALIQVKVEVDTDPPAGFETEAKTLLLPIPFSVNTFQQPDLFAGKVHAILMRKWGTRVKGRDYYDFVWYLARDIPLRIHHLEARLRQSGGWSSKKIMTRKDVLTLLTDKFNQLDITAAIKDVSPFLKDAASTKLWTKDFFKEILEKIKVI